MIRSIVAQVIRVADVICMGGVDHCSPTMTVVGPDRLRRTSVELVVND